MDTSPLHTIQIDIIRELLFHPQCRFRDLNSQQLSSDHLSFHLRRLIELGLIEKTTDDQYRLTTQGKHFADTIDTRTFQVESQAKLSVVVMAIRWQGRKMEYLFQQRLKHPYYGYWGVISGKIRRGETPQTAGERELYEETNLTGHLKLIGVEHKRDYNLHQPTELLADKYFFVFLAQDLTGELNTNFPEGKNVWLSETQIRTLPNVFEDIPNLLSLCHASHLTYSEFTCQVEGY